MKKMLKVASYAVAPKLAFATMHPKRAAMMKAGRWALGMVTPERRKPSYGKMALKGIGAAAVALPVGMWLGRKARRSGNE